MRRGNFYGRPPAGDFQITESPFHIDELISRGSYFMDPQCIMYQIATVQLSQMRDDVKLIRKHVVTGRFHRGKKHRIGNLRKALWA